MKILIQKWNNISLIKRIICGLIIGIALGLIFPQATAISILGDLFVGALRGIAPLLVFFLIMSSLCRMAKGQKTNMSFIVILYLLGNLFSALSAVIASYLFPVTLTFSRSTNTQDITPPTGVTEVLKNLLMNVVANPVDSLVNANYIGILAWAIILGIALKSASDGTKNALENISDAIATAVKWIIWYHGTDLHYNLRAGTRRSSRIRTSDLRTGRNHALRGTYYESTDYIYLPS